MLFLLLLLCITAIYNTQKKRIFWFFFYLFHQYEYLIFACHSQTVRSFRFYIVSVQLIFFFSLNFISIRKYSIWWEIKSGWKQKIFYFLAIIMCIIIERKLTMSDFKTWEHFWSYIWHFTIKFKLQVLYLKQTEKKTRICESTEHL